MKYSLTLLSSLCMALVSAGTIPEVAIGAAPEFTTLVAALQAAELVDTLSGDGPFTVFAPTNAAFDALGEVVNQLLLPCNSDALNSVLTYHVVSGKVESGDLSDGQTATTLEGSTVDVKLDANGVMINDSKVTTPDIPAKNGVIHEIDAVLVPSTVDVLALPTKCLRPTSAPSSATSSFSDNDDESTASASSVAMSLALTIFAS